MPQSFAKTIYFEYQIEIIDRTQRWIQVVVRFGIVICKVLNPQKKDATTLGLNHLKIK